MPHTCQASGLLLSHGGQFNGTDTNVKRQANRHTETAPGSGRCGGDCDTKASGRREKVEAEALPLYPAGPGRVREPEREQPIRGQELPNQQAEGRVPRDNS